MRRPAAPQNRCRNCALLDNPPLSAAAHNSELDSQLCSRMDPTRLNYVVEAAPGCHVAAGNTGKSWGRRSVYRPVKFGLSHDQQPPELSVDPDSGLLTVINADEKKVLSFFVTLGYVVRDLKGREMALGWFRRADGCVEKCVTFIVCVQPRQIVDVCVIDFDQPLFALRPDDELLQPPDKPLQPEDKESCAAGISDNSEKKVEDSGEEGAAGSKAGRRSGDADNSKGAKKMRAEPQDENPDSEVDVEDGGDELSNADDNNNASNSEVEEEGPGEVLIFSDVKEVEVHPQPEEFDPRVAFPFPLGGPGPFLCTQGECGCFTHFYPGTLHAIDLACAVGTPVLALGDGEVVQVTDTNTVSGIHVYNLFRWNSIMVRYDLPASTSATTSAKAEAGKQKDSALSVFVEYVHIKAHSARVKVGDRVKHNDVLCESGDVGFCPEPHLHIQAALSAAPTAPSIRFALLDDKGSAYFPRAGSRFSSRGLHDANT
eukprot:m.189130 g.189130  ORF g.189130 m.189130 type:complete len:486 (-) comp17544_c1_seq5:937-2394(-)